MSENNQNNSENCKSRPQYTVDELYFTIFSEQRMFDQGGEYYYIEVKKNTRPTGIRVFDNYLNNLNEEQYNIWHFCNDEGISVNDFYGLCRILTGMQLVDFKCAWVGRTIMDLLRYTDLTIEEVAAYSGAGSISQMSRICYRISGYSPFYCRRHIRKPGDVGRYRL